MRSLRLFRVCQIGKKQRIAGILGFARGTDIKIDDVVINPAKERLYITETQASYFQKEQEQIKAFYMTEVEKKRKETEQHQSTIYNIGTAYGSVIGTANTATINYQTSFRELRDRAEAENAPDKEQVQKLIDLVEMIVNEQIPPQRGLLSKFSETMERHSWVTSAVASALVSWLTQLPH